MKRFKTFLYILLILSFFIPSRQPPSIEAAPVPQIPQTIKIPETNKEQAIRLIKHFSSLYKVSYREMYETIKYETGGTFDPMIQSRYYYKGKREDSHGLSQIHLPSHPDVSKAEAQDPSFSVEFMAQQFSKGNQSIWTGWRILKTRGII